MRQKIASSAVKRVTPRAAHLGGITVADQHPGVGRRCVAVFQAGLLLSSFRCRMALKIEAAGADGKPSCYPSSRDP